MASLARQCLRLDLDQQRAETHTTPKFRKLQAEVEKLGLQLSNDQGSMAKGLEQEPEKAGRIIKLQNKIKRLTAIASWTFLER